ncbi:MAG TPA: hypoxanthine phosphoribosyltransferase [Symbiobacteriaceae bacterium]|nr:hypoxanthine phosphoribosyltransferase [Symbiobacteriaceae bacterium]
MALGLAGTLLTSEQIAERVQAMGAQITRESTGADLLVISVLKGAFVFTADLIRSIDLPCQIEFVSVSSYGSGTESAGKITVRQDLSIPIKGRHVLVVEDIVDTGTTLAFLRERLLDQSPASLRIATLLDKPSRRKTEVPVDYVGFAIPDEFVVGYGIDWAERFRSLPFIGMIGELPE